jgi:hypothetical protein
MGLRSGKGNKYVLYNADNKDFIMFAEEVRIHKNSIFPF